MTPDKPKSGVKVLKLTLESESNSQLTSESGYSQSWAFGFAPETESESCLEKRSGARG